MNAFVFLKSRKLMAEKGMIGIDVLRNCKKGYQLAGDSIHDQKKKKLTTKTTYPMDTFIQSSKESARERKREEQLFDAC